MARMNWGAAPWSYKQWNSNFQDKVQVRLEHGAKLNRKLMQKMGLGYGLGRGYFHERNDSTAPTQPSGPEETVTLPNGKTVKVIINQAGPFLGFQKMNTPEAAEKIQKYMFDPDKKVYQVDGCGHIKELRYSQEGQILIAVFFHDDAPEDIVAYLPCPAVLAGKLFALAKSKATRSDGRHLLGIQFWDEVRIRGQRTGGKIPYQYIQGGGVGGHIGTHSQERDIEGREYMPPQKNLKDKEDDASEPFREAEEDMRGARDTSSPVLNSAMLSGRGTRGRELPDALKIGSEDEAKYRNTCTAYYMKYRDKLTPVQKERVQQLSESKKWKELYDQWESWLMFMDSSNGGSEYYGEEGRRLNDAIALRSRGGMMEDLL